ncbi:hypothetical protein OIA45_00245 [Streptomyces chartreusis]|nr:hypothetical protein OIA45_00245 [Streptomyces chartreusis]
MQPASGHPGTTAQDSSGLGPTFSLDAWRASASELSGRALSLFVLITVAG